MREQNVYYFFLTLKAIQLETRHLFRYVYKSTPVNVYYCAKTNIVLKQNFRKIYPRKKIIHAMQCKAIQCAKKTCIIVQSIHFVPTYIGENFYFFYNVKTI